MTSPFSRIQNNPNYLGFNLVEHYRMALGHKFCEIFKQEPSRALLF